MSTHLFGELAREQLSERMAEARHVRLAAAGRVSRRHRKRRAWGASRLRHGLRLGLGHLLAGRRQALR